VALAAAVTAPLSNPITRAGQHQAPIKAGIEITRMNIDIKRPFLSTFSGVPSLVSLTNGVVSV